MRDTIEVSDSALSKQSTQLEAAGYVKIRKGYVGKRPRTWLSLTSAGGRLTAAISTHCAPSAAVPSPHRSRALRPPLSTHFRAWMAGPGLRSDQQGAEASLGSMSGRRAPARRPSSLCSALTLARSAE